MKTADPIPQSPPRSTDLQPRSTSRSPGGWQRLRERTPLGWLQLKRNRSRMLVAVAGIAFADLLLFAQLGIQAALYDSNTLLIRQMQADIVIRGSQYRNLSFPTTFARRRLYQAQSLPGVAAVDPLYIGSINWRNPQTREKTQLTLVGQDPERSLLDIPELTQQQQQLKLPDRVLFDRLSRGDYQQVIEQVEAGQPITTEIDRQTITISGTFSLGASFATDGTLVSSPSTFLRLNPRRSAGQVSLGLVHLEPGYDPEIVAQQLSQLLPEDVLVRSHQGYLEDELAYFAERSPIGIVFGFGAAMAFVVGIVIVFQILSTDVNDHMPEYATFKAMGYQDRYLLMVIFEEAVILAVLGFIPGLGLALAQYALVRRAASLPLTMTLSRLIWVLVLTIIMCGISGAFASRRLRSADPADIF